MKKVLNWTIGSFFRTIGRTIAFLVMGGLIYYILTYNGFGIEDLFFERVSAMSLDGILDREIATGPNDYQFFLWDYGLGGGSNTYRFEQEFDFDVPFTPNGATYAVFPIEGITYTIGDLKITDFQIKIYLKSDKNYAMCEIQNNLITCGLDQSRTYTGIKMWLRPITYFANNEEWDVEYRVNRNVSLYKTNSQEIIDNQNSNTQQIIEQQQNSTEQILDSNTTEAEEEATSFFEDFDVPDVGGLSAIITAPLNTIRSLLNSSCTNLSVPLPYMNNKNLTLPCMGPIYTEHFGLFFTLYQTIILAIVSYRCIRSIYFDIHGFTNPNDDRIEVMDL